MNTNKLDARKLKVDQQHALRIRFVNAWINEGKKNIAKLSRIFHVSYYAAWTWVTIYVKHGWDGLKDKGKGKHTGNYRYISKTIMDEIEDIILNKLPKDYELPGTVWSSKIITRLVKEKYDIKITPRGMRKYLNERGLSFLKDTTKEKRTK